MRNDKFKEFREEHLDTSRSVVLPQYFDCTKPKRSTYCLPLSEAFCQKIRQAIKLCDVLQINILCMVLQVLHGLKQSAEGSFGP